MKTMYFRLVYSGLFAMTVLLVCCVDKRKSTFLNVDSHFTSQSFQEKKLLKGTKLELGTLLAPVHVFFHDSLLFVTKNGLESNVYVFNSNDNYLPLGSIIPNGMGPDELLSVARMDFSQDGTFWAHDITTAHVKRFELIMDKDTVYAIARNNISLKGPVINAFYLDTDLIGTTTQEIKPLSRFYVYDAQGNRINEAGDYPTYNRDIPATAKVEVYNGWVSVHPSYNKFVLVYEFTDLIEFYDSDFKLLKRVQGPHNFLPEFELKQRGNSVAMVRRFDLTRFAYQRAVSNDSMIFLLYANGETVSKEDDPEEAAHFNFIVAIDWEGNPLYLFELDHAVISIAVDWKKRIIYGLNRIESEVYAFSF